MRIKKLFLVLIFLLLFFEPLVLAQEEKLKELELIIPTNLNENEQFTITVTCNGTPVGNAIVIYNNSIFKKIYKTDYKGEITVYTPEITSNDDLITLNIFTAKKDYFSNETKINITNLPNLIFKDKENSYYEAEPNESILINIIDNFGNPVEEVKIEIFDYNDVIMTYYTDSTGSVTIKAPNPDHRKGDYQITASKTGYPNAENYLMVYTPHSDYSLIGVYVICPIIFFVMITIISIAIIYPIMKDKNNGNNRFN